MIFKIFLSGKYNLKIKISVFSAETRNLDFQNKITKLRRLSRDL